MNSHIIKIALAVVVLIILYRLFVAKKKGSRAPESFEDYDPTESFLGPANPSGAPMYSNPSGVPVSGVPVSGAPVTLAPMSSSVDLLPTPQSKPSEFGEFAPKNLGSQNFVDSTKLIGVDTVGSSLRNANYDLRRVPAIKRVDVGPWQGSTIEADLYRRALDC